MSNFSLTTTAPGQIGPAGPTGPQGITGAAGADGADGTSGGGYNFTDLTSVTINSDQDNYLFPISPSSGLRVDPNGSDRDFTGFIAQPDDTYKLIFNISPDKKLKLKDQDSGSLAINRMALPDNADYDVHEYTSVLLRYDAPLARWHLVGQGK